jgi:hypothetical protein
MPTRKTAAHEPGRRRATIILTPLLRLWQRLLNRWRRRIGWERMDTGDLPRLVGYDTRRLQRSKAEANGDGASDEQE